MGGGVTGSVDKQRSSPNREKGEKRVHATKAGGVRRAVRKFKSRSAYLGRRRGIGGGPWGHPSEKVGENYMVEGNAGFGKRKSNRGGQG